MYVFVTKKLLSSLASPLTLVFFLIIAAIILICKNKKKTSILLLCICFLLMLITGSPFVVNPLTQSLEGRYQPLVTLPPHISKIIVLGASTRGKYPTANQVLGDASLARVIEGIRLTKMALKKHRKILLVLSGGSLGKLTAAQSMADFAEQFGIPQHILSLETGSLDTQAEAKALYPLLKSQPFVLVTSAVHMPRAIQIFRAYHMHPIAAPTQFNSTMYNPIPILNVIPNAATANRFHQYWHEVLGSLWYKITQAI